MHTLDFVHKYRGRFVTAPGGAGKQCVDLINMYLIERWGLAPIRLNAIDWQHTVVPGYVWVPNSPDNSPSLAALIVWGQDATVGTGPFGHIALGLVADANELVSFDQDWPFGSPCILQLHSYQGVLGWHELAGS